MRGEKFSTKLLSFGLSSSGNTSLPSDTFPLGGYALGVQMNFSSKLSDETLNPNGNTSLQMNFSSNLWDDYHYYQGRDF